MKQPRTSFRSGARTATLSQILITGADETIAQRDVNSSAKLQILGRTYICAANLRLGLIPYATFCALRVTFSSSSVFLWCGIQLKKLTKMYLKLWE